MRFSAAEDVSSIKKKREWIVNFSDDYAVLFLPLLRRLCYLLYAGFSCWLVGLWPVLPTIYSTNYHENLMEDVSQPRIYPINFWCRSLRENWSNFLTVFIVVRAALRHFCLLFVNFSRNTVWIMMTKVPFGIKSFQTYTALATFAHKNQNMNIQNTYTWLN